MVFHQAGTALALEGVAVPTPGSDELLVRVHVCGVCRTDLDLVDGRLAPPRMTVIPGHQVVGEVVAGVGDDGPSVGDRVGIAWIHWADGVCRWCRSGRENLCPQFQSTGCDVNGGYAEYVTVPRAFAYAIPRELSDAEAAPLLCAGAVGWRSLRLANISDGEALGLTGFGASAHLVLQLARHRYPRSPIYVFARQSAEREFASTLGATWVGSATDSPPQRCAAIIDTTPAWKPVIEGLERLESGGRLVVNAIRKMTNDQQELLRLDYSTHLWMEREVKSVANVTRTDVREVLAVAVEMRLRPTVDEMPLERANEALDALRRGEAVHGARVLRVA
jgi:propanol-preferring alcohol dehydrogenase